MADFSEGQTRPKAALSALKPLIPFGLAYKGRIAAALVALAVASAATLVVPVAVRRVDRFRLFASRAGPTSMPISSC